MAEVNKLAKNTSRDFPGGPVFKTPGVHCRRHRFDPWSGNEAPTGFHLQKGFTREHYLIKISLRRVKDARTR